MGSKIDAFFASLGNTSDEVAASLLKLGALGKRRSECNCPVAQAFKLSGLGWPGLRIAGGPEHYWATYRDCQIMDPVLPKPVIEFVRRFDAGEYQELVGSPR